jgi:predicted TIM-barrel fold metal-dependent hydrolase
MSRALAHLGEHIADLRTPESGLEAAGLYQLEYRAWMTTMLGAVLQGQKSLMLLGGYVVWSSAWPKDSLNKNTDGALTGFFANEAQLSK